MVQAQLHVFMTFSYQGCFKSSFKVYRNQGHLLLKQLLNLRFVLKFGTQVLVFVFEFSHASPFLVATLLFDNSIERFVKFFLLIPSCLLSSFV